MKSKIFLVILLFISVSCLGKHTYTLSKADLIFQFSGKEPSRSTMPRVYCVNEKGEKVWLNYNQNSLLTLHFANNKKRTIFLKTVRYENDTIKAREYNVWLENHEIRSFYINDILEFTIEDKNHEFELPYFNMDSCRAVAKMKNDSIKKEYATGREWLIRLKEKSGEDTFYLLTAACYQLSFKDGKRITDGVVFRITSDSLYVSNYFNANMAKAAKDEYTIYKYAIADIAKLHLPSSGGYGGKHKDMQDYDIATIEVDKTELRAPCWYAVFWNKGEVRLYRTILLTRGAPGITEVDGRAIWYEGEYTK